QVPVGRGLAAGPTALGHSIADQLGEGVQRVGARGPPPAPAPSRALADRLQLDGASERVGDGCRLLVTGGTGGGVQALGPAWLLELCQPGRFALPGPVAARPPGGGGHSFGRAAIYGVGATEALCEWQLAEDVRPPDRVAGGDDDQQSQGVSVVSGGG